MGYGWRCRESTSVAQSGPDHATAKQTHPRRAPLRQKPLRRVRAERSEQAWQQLPCGMAMLGDVQAPPSVGTSCRDVRRRIGPVTAFEYSDSGCLRPAVPREIFGGADAFDCGYAGALRTLQQVLGRRMSERAILSCSQVHSYHIVAGESERRCCAVVRTFRRQSAIV
jgi:hypothetical protein